MKKTIALLAFAAVASLPNALAADGKEQVRLSQVCQEKFFKRGEACSLEERKALAATVEFQMRFWRSPAALFPGGTTARM